VLAAALLAAGVASAAPPGDEPAGRVVLRWQAVPGASGYDLQISAEPTFARRLREVRVELAGYRLGALPEVRWYWRVRSVDAEGRPGPWSSTKTVEPLVRAPEPLPEPEPVILDVPALAAEAVEPAAPVGADGANPAASAAPRALEPPSELVVVPEAEMEGIRVLDVLREGRPGVLVGWRHNLLEVDSPVVAIEGAWRLPWLGAGWGGSLRIGWWGDRSEVGGGFAKPIPASADVIPVTALVTRSFPWRWARLYAGAGAGVDLVVVRVGSRGALEASAALDAVAGAGRPAGPGELFCELQGGLGGVDGPLGKLRTGGLSLSLGYRLGR
jgi:hypothetical protein